MTVIAIILAGSAPLPVSSTRDLVVNMRQPHFARVRARRNCATNAGRELNSGVARNVELGGHHRGRYARCRRQCIEVCSADQSARSVEIIFAFIFRLSGWALVAPSCFALRIPDV